MPGTGLDCPLPLRYRRGPGLEPGLGLGGFFLQAGAVAGDGPFHGTGQVVQQVPAVSDLDGERRAVGCSFGVAAAPVPADHFCAGVGVQPCPEGLRGPLREHVHRPAGLDVDHAGCGGIQQLPVRASRMAARGWWPWLRAVVR